VLDVNEADLARIYDLAAEHSKSHRLEPWQVKLASLLQQRPLR